TVCQPTKQRQLAAVELAQLCDLVVVVGGAASNNTRELVSTCRRFCSQVYHVQNAGDLRTEWFNAVETVGITAGTSTPDVTIDAVEHWSQKLSEIRSVAAAPSNDTAYQHSLTRDLARKDGPELSRSAVVA